MKWYKRLLDHDEKGEAILSLEVPNWIGGSKCQVLINLSQEIESLVVRLIQEDVVRPGAHAHALAAL